MTQSVDVLALFDRLALLATGGAPGDGLTLEERFTAIDDRFTIIENMLRFFGVNPPPPDPDPDPDPGNWFDLRNAIIVGESPVYDTNNSAKKIFDSPDDPYYKGTDQSSTWISENVESPYVIVDARVQIKVKSVIFYHWGAENSDQYPDMRHIPRNFNVYSGTSATGPWILQGRNSYVVDETSAFHEHECPMDYNSNTTSRFWKINING